MGYTRAKFEKKGFLECEYKQYFRLNQAEYIRIKLRSIQLYSEGSEFASVAEALGIHHQSVRKYVNVYLQGGFKTLCQKVKRPQSSMLNAEQCESFKGILLSKRPFEVGLSGNIWTGELMCAYLKKAYDVVYKSGIYDLLERLNLTHQKAHADYGNANVAEQKIFIETLKCALLEADGQTAVLKFDEFSVCEKPSAYYGWAEKNTRPKFTTNEKKENAAMGF